MCVLAFFLFLFFLSCPPNLALRNCTVSSLFLRDALGRDKQVFPGGVTWVGLAGFVGWVLEEKGDERWRRPVSSSFPPLPLCPPRPVPSSFSPPPRPGPGCPCSEGTPGGKRRSQRLSPSISASLHLSVLPSNHLSIPLSLHSSILLSFCPSSLPSLPPTGVSVPHNSKSLISS